MKETFINYDVAYNHYNKNLIDKLRDFSNSEEYFYFDYWIPNENLLKSISNLIDSLIMHKISTVKIEILNKYFDISFKNFINKYEELVIEQSKIKKIIKINTDQFKNLEIDFDVKDKIITKKNLKININTKAKTLRKDEVLKNYLFNSVSKNINLEEFKQANKTNNIITDKKNMLYFAFNNEYVLIDAAHNFPSKENVEIIDCFCKIIINKKLYEIKDHGLIWLENSFRKSKLSDGITIPSAMEIFHEINKNLLNLINDNYDLFDKFKKNNEEYPKIDLNWKSRTEKEQLNILNKEINNYILNNKLEFNFQIIRLEHNFKIFISIKDYDKLNLDIGKILLDLESYLKSLVFRFEIFLEQAQDSNALRVGKLNYS